MESITEILIRLRDQASTKNLEQSALDEKDRIKSVKDFVKKNLPRKYWFIDTDREDEYNEFQGRSLFISGPAGCGKTVFASAMAKYYAYDMRHVEWLSYPEYVMELQKAYKNDQEEGPLELARKIAVSDVLILDDFGAEKLTDFVRQMTYYLLNKREQDSGWGNELITIITSNYTLDEIDKQIDSRVSSRIAGICEVLKFSGNDRRIENKP